MATKVRIEGLAELGRALRELPKQIAGKGGGPLRYATFQAAKVIKEEAIQRAPVDSGTLRRNIVAVRMRKTPPGREGYLIEVRRGKRKYANTRANVRLRRAGKTWFDRGEAYYWFWQEFGRKDTNKYRHTPFLRPAFEAKKVEASFRFREAFRIGIERAIRMVAKR